MCLYSILASDLKFELGYFGTKDVTAHQLMMQFWRAVAVLEDTCNLQYQMEHRQIGPSTAYIN